MDAFPGNGIPSRRRVLARIAAGVFGLNLCIGHAQAAAFADCLHNLRAQAAARGIDAATFDANTSDLHPDADVLRLLDAQPEFQTPIWDYLAVLVDNRRIADGQAMQREYAPLLQKISAQYRVPAETVLAVWGVESDYGRNFGKRPLLQSLATLSCAGRRQDYFRGEFFATLALIQSGDLNPAGSDGNGLKGSWAGAFGHTQFMPTTYRRIAVDGDGDGRRDLVNSVPDALASTANFLHQAGWQPGVPWGFEVRVPRDFDVALEGRKSKRPLRGWAALGVTRADGSPLPQDAIDAAIILPAGLAGPAFAVTRNFDAAYAYNAAESYTLAITLLGDRIAGAKPLLAAWPTDDPGLDRDERKQLQAMLLARGHAIGEADGMVGTQTRHAIAIEEQRLGLRIDGRASRKVLHALRGEGEALSVQGSDVP